MPIRDMLRYAALRAEGAGTEASRRELLVKHREHVRAHVAELNACLLVLNAKIDGYVETEKRIEIHGAAFHQRQREPAGARKARAG